jgi:hypothetical protein
MNNLRGAVMIAYPAYHGLPPWEPAVLLLENKHFLEGQETDIGEVINKKNLKFENKILNQIQIKL